MLCNINANDVISAPDAKTIYDVPSIMHEEGLDEKIIRKFGIKADNENMEEWKTMVESIHNSTKTVKIAMVGKYFATCDYTLTDSYISVIEAINHACWHQGYKPEFSWINSEDLEYNKCSSERRNSNDNSNDKINDSTYNEKFSTENFTKDILISKLKNMDVIVIPQGWGSRGIEGKIAAIKFARENKIPYLGLCFGMQMAVIEFARNVCNLKDANTEEAGPTPYPVIHIMPNQKEYLENHQYGGTIRLGSYPCMLKKDTLIKKAYGTDAIAERHRHRYELNNEFRQQLEEHGLIISGTSPDGLLVEAIELKDHPFFVGVQFHLEYKSRFLAPHPLFLEFIRKCLKESI